MNNLYFSQHFRASRPYFRRDMLARALEAVRARGFEGANQVFFDAIIKAAKAQGVEGQRLLEGNFFSNEVMLAQSLAQLEMDGTPLYHIAPDLLDALAHSDPGDMQLDDIRTPTRSYALHWGPQPDLLLFGKYPVEGAVILSSSPDWRIGLVARTPHDWLLPPERDSFMLRFPAETLRLPFAQAVDQAIQRDIEDLEAILQGAIVSAKVSDDGRLQAVERAKMDMQSCAPVLKRALDLVGNCIAYLTAYPDDSRYDWEPDTPQSMRVKLGRGGKEQQRTASKLSAMGYIQVHQVGLDFQQTVQKTLEHRAGEGLEDAGVRPHWRRGHWRHQAYGEKHSLRKLIWLRPTRVLGAGATLG